MKRRSFPVFCLTFCGFLLTMTLLAQGPVPPLRGGAGALPPGDRPMMAPTPFLETGLEGCDGPGGGMMPGRRMGPGGDMAQGGPPMSPFGVWRDEKMCRMLDLSEDRMAQLKSKDAAFVEKCQSLRDDLDQARVDLDRAFARKPLSPESVQACAKHLAEVRQQDLAFQVGSRLEARELVPAPPDRPGAPPMMGPAGQAGPCLPSPFGLWRNYRDIERLGLTEAQIASLKEKDAAFIRNSRELGYALGPIQAELGKALAADPADKGKVQAALQKLADHGLKAITLETNARLDLLQILPPDQACKQGPGPR